MIQSVFKILSVEQTASSIIALIQVDAGSAIFKGHFPDQPVVPGACMLQTVKEILQDTLQISIRLVKADNIKFLNMIAPGVADPILNIKYTSTDDQVKITADLNSGEQLFMKLQATFTAK